MYPCHVHALLWKLKNTRTFCGTVKVFIYWSIYVIHWKKTKKNTIKIKIVKACWLCYPVRSQFISKVSLPSDLKASSCWRISDGWVFACGMGGLNTVRNSEKHLSSFKENFPDTRHEWEIFIGWGQKWFPPADKLAPDRWGRESVRKGYNSLSHLLVGYRSSHSQPRYGTMFVMTRPGRRSERCLLFPKKCKDARRKPRTFSAVAV